MGKKDEEILPERQPLWYKDAIVYELHVRAYFDSDGNGIGDFRGLTEKLDYLADLGITAIWLLPFYPSPLKDDGYDIADYTGVNPNYGSLADIKALVREAHKRGLRVITELVCNHTSDQHPWFQRARRSPRGSAARDFYVWSDESQKYKDARIIFKDFERSNWSWDPVANAYYWHRFFSHQPDLNFENPEVRRALFRVLDFWLKIGIDGLRLDAVPYLYEREGTSCENLPETHAFLKDLRTHVDKHFEDRMLLAEANQWPEEAVPYFGEGDECHMAFHFPLMPRLFMSIHMEDRFPIIEILRQTPQIPESAQWALFLRNHDELTLEMVTDEERDYMYRVYAEDHQARINLGIRRRLAPLLGNDRRKIELMNGLLFSLPGTPVIYYGDEIGMGDNIYLGDRNGVRTPMQWSADRNAGFSRTNPQRLFLPVITDPEYHYEAINVEALQNNSSSLLWWMKRLIAHRKRHRAFGRGKIEFLHPENNKVLVFLRSHEDERILVVANLSRFVQCVELDLSAFKASIPVEIFGKIEFPAIEDRLYFLTLGPYSFYWFLLQPPRPFPAHLSIDDERSPVLTAKGVWSDVLQGKSRALIEEMLPRYLPGCRWFGGKARRIKSAQITEVIPIAPDKGAPQLTMVEVEYTEGQGETYLLPLAFASNDRAHALIEESPRFVLCRMRIRSTGEEGVLYDPLVEPSFGGQLFSVIAGKRRTKGEKGELAGATTKAFRALRGSSSEKLEAAILRAEQSNTSVVYGDRFILKLFRKVEPGINPDVEIGRFLTEKAGFKGSPLLAGTLEYARPKGEPYTFGILQGFVHSEGDAWRYTIHFLVQYFDRALTRPEPPPEVGPVDIDTLLDVAHGEPPPYAHETMGGYLEAARLLGRRTAEMHLALASDLDSPDFMPEPFTPFYQRSIYQSMRNLSSHAFQTLQRAEGKLEGELREMAREALALEEAVLKRFQQVHERKITAMRVRHHGDYHLGQVLYTGKDFVIIDFEGEPMRSLSERRLKRSALRDVAGMLRSFHYAAEASLYGLVSPSRVRREDLELGRPLARFFYKWASAAFLSAYLGAARGAPFLPETRSELSNLLGAYLLEKAVYEMGYELNNRPEWVRIAFDGVLSLMRERAPEAEDSR